MTSSNVRRPRIRTAPRIAALGLCGLVAAACIAPPPPGFSQYRIDVGSHVASVLVGDGARAPLAGVTTASRRTVTVELNPSFRYVITRPVEPGDQWDYNKMPGLSDCAQFDLARDGLMWAWRWNTEDEVLELATYANNASTHLFGETVATFSAAQLDAKPSVTLGIEIRADDYLFTYRHGSTTRSISMTRRCADTSVGASKWASGLYFGGTSTAPSIIWANVKES